MTRKGPCEEKQQCERVIISRLRPKPVVAADLRRRSSAKNSYSSQLLSIEHYFFAVLIGSFRRALK